MSRVAINVCDLSCFSNPKSPIQMTALLLQDFITKDSPTVLVNDMVDSGVVILDGPASKDGKRVDALVELLQTVLGPKKIGRRVRCYREGERGGWSEIVVRKAKGGVL